MAGTIDLIAPAEKAMRLLSTAGLDFYDVFSAYSRTMTVTLLGKGINEARSSIDLGLGVRAYKNKGLGIASSQSLDPSDIETTVNKAVSFVNVAQPDPYFKRIPGPTRANPVPGLQDKAIISLTMEEAAGMSKRMIDAAEATHSGAMYEGGMNVANSMGFLMTSTGVSVEAQKTYVSAYLVPTYRNGDDVGSSYEYDYAISLAEIDFERIGKRASEKAMAQFGSKGVESTVLPLVVAPDAVSSLCFGLLAAVSGEPVVKGRTFASKSLGQQVAPEIVQIQDDGTISGGIGSNTYDGEGVPRRPTKVLDKGTVLTFLHNSYSAGIAGVETTGHAQRAGYGGYVGAGPSNVQFKPGNSSQDEMIAETSRGILVNVAGFNTNMVSGELSSTIDEGFLIEKGEKKHPVKNLMIGGRLLELYKNIELVSKEGRTIGKGYFFPAVKISEAKLAGK